VVLSEEQIVNTRLDRKEREDDALKRRLRLLMAVLENVQPSRFDEDSLTRLGVRARSSASLDEAKKVLTDSTMSGARLISFMC
jgi:hypothetical protein